MSNYIVLIDDDDDDRLLFGQAIKSSGIEALYKDFFSAKTFFEHMEIATENAPDIIFVDLYMPLTDGFSLLKNIRENEKFGNSKVILFSASGSERDIMLAEENMASGFVQKPSEYKQLEEIVRSTIEHFDPDNTIQDFFVKVS